MTQTPSRSPHELFPTYVVGSLPRPEWLRKVILDRGDGLLGTEAAEELFDAAIPSAIAMQERAGVDFVSDGEWRRESYIKVISEHVDGFEPGLMRSASNAVADPAVVAPIKQRDDLTTGAAEFLLSHTDHSAIVTLPSPYILGWRTWKKEFSSGAYPTREEFMQACIPIIRQEIHSLVSLGVDAIQLDDPWLALLVDPDYRERSGITDIEHEIELCLDCVNGATEGFEDVFISVHMCHAHFNRSHSTRGAYDLIIGALARMNVSRFAMEYATPDAGGLDSLKNFPDDKILGLGVIDHTDPHIETADEVVDRVKHAMEYVPKERITLNPDCGFSPSSANPMDFDEAYLKLRSMCEAAKELRERYS